MGYKRETDRSGLGEKLVLISNEFSDAMTCLSTPILLS